MRKSAAQAALSIPVILLIAAAIGWAGSQGGQRVGAIPVFALCGALCFALNWLVFVHAYAAQTERYFDLTGSLTYLTVVTCGVALGSRDPRALLLALLVGAWALRPAGMRHTARSAGRWRAARPAPGSPACPLPEPPSRRAPPARHTSRGRGIRSAPVRPG
jgi:hypothetical protein